MTDEKIPGDLTERYPNLVFHKVRGFDSWYGVDADGRTQVTACGRGPGDVDPSLERQQTIETGSQVVGADDEWA